ncbi:MAG TPA: AMP-binding protein [Solirubrobacteraceae bacterium]|nr:AMP-binding protein [Solirubrobacteraceae bacterium]
MEPWLERAAGLRPDRVAVEAPEGSLTYAELLERARAAARGLEGVVPIDLPAGLDFAVRLHACLLAGAAAMPVDPRLGERERAALTTRAAPGTALIVHTSGTTGAPQPVELTQANILANALGTAVALGHDPDERWLCPLPLSHVGGLMVLLRSAISATTAVIGPPDRDDVTLVSLVPTMLARLLEAGAPPRRVMLGGAPADRALLTRARDAGWPVAPTYGLTQACSAVTVGEPGDVATSGRALPGLTVTIAPDGEILVAGPTVAGGGTLRTGDLGRLDERGRLIVTGRKADTIVSGGENVAPTEVEAVLLEHPAVADAGVFSRPHTEWGEAVTARVVLRATATEQELREWAGERLARYKVPKTIELAEALPRTASGKLLRRELT